jgi:geranylgeranyl diphosphate synthase type II
MDRPDDTIKALSGQVDAALAELFSRTQIPAQVKEAMWYSVSAGGKRLRPVLILLFAQIFGASIAQAMPYACAMEMIHTYSLIHDDLPAMDNDDLRRGKPTCHKVYGEAMALLAGDALLNFAYETLFEAALRDGQAGMRAAQRIAAGAGVTGMVAGQCMDLCAERDGADYAVDQIHAAKTGAMICAACAAGALIGGADASQVDACTRYGKNLGLAFQIVDDILDVTGDSDTLGKPIGSDMRNQKRTFVSEYGLSRARQMAQEATHNAVAALEKLPSDAGVLRALAWQMLERRK